MARVEPLKRAVATLWIAALVVTVFGGRAAGAGTVFVPGSVSVSPQSATVSVDGPHTVTATVSDQNGEPLFEASVDFEVEGANPGLKCSDVSTDANGQASCTYTGANAGNDSITAIAEKNGQTATGTATATWEERQSTTTTSTTTPTVVTTTEPAVTTTSAAEATTTTDTTEPSVTTTTVVIEGEDVGAEEPRDRTAFAAALPRPSELNLDAESIVATSLLVILLLVLIGFPAEIFNKTWEENNADIQRLLGRSPPAGDDPVAPPPTREATPGRRGLQFLAVAAIAAMLYGFLEPGFSPFSRQGAALMVGLLLAIVIVTATFELTQAVVVRQQFGIRGLMAAYPGTILIAVVCVVLSRALAFVPGYLYGLVADMRVEGLRDEEEGPSLTVAAVVLVALGALAWVAWLPVDDRMGTGRPGFGLLVLDATLVGVVVASIESLLFGMLPMTFLDGGKVVGWRRGVWMLLEALGAFAMMMIVMHPEAGLVDTATDASVFSMVVLFAVFGALSLAFWGWFRRRRRRIPAP